MGGTWCPSNPDCTYLKDCISNEINFASSNEGLTPYKIYLESSPEIVDPYDYNQCGKTKEYFGFKSSFVNEKEICNEIKLLF